MRNKETVEWKRWKWKETAKTSKQEAKLYDITDSGNCQEEREIKAEKDKYQEGMQQAAMKRDKKQYYDNVCKDMNDGNRHGKNMKVL